MREENKLFVLNYCTGLTWLMGTKSQKNPFQVCMSGGCAVSRLETRFQALRDRRVTSPICCIFLDRTVTFIQYHLSTTNLPHRVTKAGIVGSY